MKKHHNKYLLFVLAAMAALIAVTCTDRGTAAFTSTSFRDKSWKLVKLTVTPAIDWDLNGAPDRDIFTLLDDCEQDDLIEFKNDHSVVRNQGPLQCDDDTLEKITGKWKYDTAQQAIVVTEDQKPTVFKIVEATAQSLTLHYPFESTGGQLHYMTAVYEATP